MEFNLKTKIRSMNKDQKRFVFMMIIVAAIFIGEIAAIVIDVSLNTAFKAGQITEIELQKKRNGLFLGLAIYTLFVFFILIEFGHYLRHARDEFQNEQALRDSYQVNIEIDKFDTFAYLFQSEPDSLQKVDSTDQMKKVLTESDLFEQLLKLQSSEVMINVDLLQSAKQKLPESESGDEILIPCVTNPIWKDLLKAFPAIFFEQGDNLHLYYSSVVSVEVVDDPEDEEIEFEDRLSGITGYFILSPDKEFQFRSRLHPTEEDIKIRKTYGNWKLYKFAFDKTPFFIDSRLLVSRLSDRTLETAEIKGLTFMTHIALDRDQELEQQLENQEADMEHYQKLIDTREDKILLRKVMNGDLEHSWKQKFEFRKMNATTIFVSVLSLVLGIMGGLIFG